MKSTLAPALATPWSTPAATTRVRRDLERSNLELASGRHADMGLALGGRSHVLVSARAQESLLRGLQDNGAISAGRLRVIQQSLEGAVTGAQDFMDALVPLKSGQGSPVQAAVHAKAALEDFFGMMNATAEGSHVFGGRNITRAPLAQYFSDPPPPSRQSVENAFQARFGFAISDPAAASISAADMRDFLDNDFAALFSPAQWKANWSSATDNAVTTLISLSEIAPVTASANNPAVRKLAMAYVMTAGLGIETLNGAARKVVADEAFQLTAEAVTGLDGMRGEIGVRQERLKRAGDRLEIQRGLVRKEIAGMEQIDPHEAAASVNALSVQLQTSYAITGRLQKLSLLNYL